jgi:hypothetical protein
MRNIFATEDLSTTQHFIETDWDYFATITLHGDTPSMGDAFMTLVDNLNRWKNRDPDLDFIFYICQRYNDERNHIHGVVKTELSRRTLERTSRGGFALFKGFETNRSADLYAYIKGQAVAPAITPASLEDII